MSCCAAQLRTQPLAVAWGRHARAVSQPRRNLVLVGVLAESGDQLVLAHGRAALDLQLTSAVAELATRGRTHSVIAIAPDGLGTPLERLH
jgi:hypothetical protein